MSFDAANELLNLNTTTYSYDQNGNRIQKTETGGITTYTYDEENRLTRVEIAGTPNQIITYAYDPFGRRIQKNVNGTITNYVYDKEAIILQYDQSGTVQARYTHGLGIDEPLAMDNNSQMYYYHADGLGSIVALTSASGSVAQRYDYDAFGNITSGAPTVTQPYTYTAREYDPETGLYFYRARYYDPKAGRFLQRDPIGFDGGDVNLYAYTANDPVNNVDTEGLFHYKEGVPPAGAEMEKILSCMDKCLGRDLGISGGSECKAPHKLSRTRGHCAGKAADISNRMNPNLDSQKVMCCAKKCGAKYGQIEGDHSHVQTHSGNSGGSGDLPACDDDCK